MSYEFIEPLKEKPKIKRKAYRRVSLAEMILNEFRKASEEDKVKFAKISFEKLKNTYKSPAFVSRAIGRVIKRLKLDKEISVYSDENNVYLEKL